MDRLIYTGARIFDGTALHDNRALVIEDGEVSAIVPVSAAPDGPRVALAGGVVAPGFVDLQVNGGGGIMLDGTAGVAEIATICEAHARLGATSVLPTLITDTPAATRAVLAAGVASVGRVPGFLGLHLEGPHLDIRRNGAHDASLIRPMMDEDLEILLEAKAGLPALFVTVAPAAVTLQQIEALERAGIFISLGHADCTLSQARAAHTAGARGVTHLFNAMSQFTSREPGLVGAALSLPFHVGLIADGVHVHAESVRLALAAKHKGEIYLVSDAMAVAGSEATSFTLGGRMIERKDRALRLADGTLAGADLSLPQALKFMIEVVGIAPERALAMASRIPAQIVGIQAGTLSQGGPADFVLLSDNWELQQVWRAGQPLQAKSSTA